jgi:tetratricopeptide (TPR) repeat protein
MIMHRIPSAPPAARLILAAILALVLAGCSGSRQAQETTAAKTSTHPTRPEPSADDRQEIALQHFLEGSTFDQKGDFARAIVEYQDALRYKEDPAIHHAIAKDYQQLEKPELALVSARRAVDLDSTSRQYRETLAEIYVNTMDLENATRQFAAIVRMDPGYKPALLNLARLTQVTSNDSALVLYNRVIDRFGPDLSAYAQMAQIYSSQGKQLQAADVLKKMLELDPESYEIKKGLGDTYLRADSIDLALKVYDDLVVIRPDDLELRASRAHAFLSKQDYESATAQFERVMSQDSISADDQIRFGRIFVSFIEKDSAVVPHALKMFRRIRDANPADWRAYWFLGAMANVANDDSSAFENFSKVTELAPWNPDGWIGVASVYYDHDQFDQAIEVLTKAKAKLPDEFRVHFLLGVSYQRFGKLPEAKTSLERAIRLDPKSIDALSALGMIFNELNQMADSDTMYERALRIDPKNHLVLNNYGYSLAERNMQIERAFGMSKEAVRQQPDNQSYLDTYGWILYQMGRYQEAEGPIRRAVELGSTSAVIHEHLGDVYAKLGQSEKALSSWRKALELNPDNAGLKEKIEKGRL